MAEDVEALATAGELTRAEAHALMVKLKAAAHQLERGKRKTAGDLLGAFVNQVEALIRSGRLDRAAGQPLKDAATCLVAGLRGGSGDIGPECAGEGSAPS